MTQQQEISVAFPFESKYAGVRGSKMHYVEEGAGEPLLFLHGNPTSAYLWRNVIPHISGQARCVALDLIGMGRSDKPDIEYRYFDHLRYLEGFIEALGLQNVTLVGHDWGGPLAIQYAREHEGNVRGIVFMETIVKPLTWAEWPEQARAAFQGFRTPGVGEKMIMEQSMFVEAVLPGAVLRKLSDEEMARYREPYPDAKSRTPSWRWPNDLPMEGEPADMVEAVQANADWMTQTRVPKLMLYAQPGALMPAPLVEWCKSSFPNLKAVDIGPGVHFIQEDQPHAIGKAIADWYGGH